MLFDLRTVSVQLLAAAAYVSASPLSFGKRAVISHDAVVGFAQTVPSGINGTLYLKYKPLLKVFNGCVPFPAVDKNGNTGGGLNTSGDSNGDCASSPGQVYVRGGFYGGSYAIMYSWYMPKDSPGPGLGHRHDWENVVVWLSTNSASATLEGVSISAHGDYQKDTSPDLSGTSPLIGYISYFPVDHQLIATTTVGGTQPLIAWESMTQAARTAIESTDFGDATPSFRDSNFQTYLAKAVL
ncbi:necrosis-and ethylene-inducing protein-like protein 1 precursor [Dothidotthia symphoricarpi CBS 119687]|uniref:Necrosis-and ethylene-inducing protein-like protein 1 n=1 Tax=Dothidotthia symphoricarpi CBS 119687 TaxID=1392245 RepID=A0A6A5ZX89_9PLEO|nr:necrosis-and ethylene-inducing protein-like protein 1 precursor [Dothidotthia symphoricarpi CBS 119687]KAF2124372.1 necrosis-and ethylene-inducing protein-like protein 1 precursor [Dothidotthia symphoricarpi CBS 119687]